MKNAIVALTRGYPQDKNLYTNLIKRNISIYKHINSKREISCDIILFHEGNISSSDQTYIKNESPEEIKFVDVSKYLPIKHLNYIDIEKFNLGYRFMCRFNMFHIWKEVKEYDYILRIDEDIKIQKFNSNLFEDMYKSNTIFTTGRFAKELHKYTNQTLPTFISKNTKLDINKIYNHKFPYTNVFATKVSFWLEKDIQELLSTIAMSDEQLIYRWGDLPVLGGVLNSKNIKIKLFKKSRYVHISHDNLVIVNNFIRNLTINSSLNPIK